MEKVIKTAIAIPKSDYERIEKLRAQTGKTRSQLLVEAFRDWLHHQDELVMENRYAQGYRRHPENIDDLKPFTQAGLTLWEKEAWS